MEISEEEVKDLVKEQKKCARMLMQRDLALIRANDKLRKINEERSELIAVAAHQLRTPLSAISWAQEMLLSGEIDGDLEPEQRKLLEQAQIGLKRSVSLVNKLLDVEHLSFGKVVYEKANTDMLSLLDEVVKNFELLVREKNISLSKKINTPGLLVFCDKSRLMEAISNIVSNAVKYTPKDGEIIVALGLENKNIILEIKDSGIGIPKSDHYRLFKKFARSDNAKRIDASGTGLGLFVSKKIIEDHHGTIGFESQEGVGTTFTVCLPVVVE